MSTPTSVIQFFNSMFVCTVDPRLSELQLCEHSDYIIVLCTFDEELDRALYHDFTRHISVAAEQFNKQLHTNEVTVHRLTM